MGRGMNWNKVRTETNTRRYGAEEYAPRDAAVPGFAAGPRRTSRRKMTPEERKRWKDAIEKVYGKRAKAR